MHKNDCQTIHPFLIPPNSHQYFQDYISHIHRLIRLAPYDVYCACRVFRPNIDFIDLCCTYRLIVQNKLEENPTAINISFRVQSYRRFWEQAWQTNPRLGKKLKKKKKVRECTRNSEPHRGNSTLSWGVTAPTWETVTQQIMLQGLITSVMENAWIHVRCEWASTRFSRLLAREIILDIRKKATGSRNFV